MVINMNENKFHLQFFNRPDIDVVPKKHANVDILSVPDDLDTIKEIGVSNQKVWSSHRTSHLVIVSSSNSS